MARKGTPLFNNENFDPGKAAAILGATYREGYGLDARTPLVPMYLSDSFSAMSDLYSPRFESLIKAKYIPGLIRRYVHEAAVLGELPEGTTYEQYKAHLESRGEWKKLVDAVYQEAKFEQVDRAHLELGWQQAYSDTYDPYQRARLATAQASVSAGRLEFINWNYIEMATRYHPNFPAYTYIYALGGQGKTNLMKIFASKALGNRNWVLANLKFDKKSLPKLQSARHVYFTEYFSDYFIDTPSNPSIIWPLELSEMYGIDFAVVAIADEKGTDKASKGTTREADKAKQLMQSKRHFRIIPVQGGINKMDDSLMRDLTAEIKPHATPKEGSLTNEGRVRYNFTFEVAYQRDLYPHDDELIVNVPQSELKTVGEDKGIDLAPQFDLDMSITRMQKEIGGFDKYTPDGQQDWDRVRMECSEYARRIQGISRRVPHPTAMDLVRVL